MNASELNQMLIQAVAGIDTGDDKHYALLVYCNPDGSYSDSVIGEAGMRRKTAEITRCMNNGKVFIGILLRRSNTVTWKLFPEHQGEPAMEAVMLNYASCVANAVAKGH